MLCVVCFVLLVVSCWLLVGDWFVRVCCCLSCVRGVVCLCCVVIVVSCCLCCSLYCLLSCLWLVM